MMLTASSASLTITAWLASLGSLLKEPVDAFCGYLNLISFLFAVSLSLT